MSFNNEEIDDFNNLLEQDRRDFENSFSDLSSISNESSKTSKKKDFQLNIKFTPEKLPKKEKKKRKKEDLNKTPLYIFDCVFCANEKTAFNILSSNKLYERYNLSLSRHDYHEINELIRFKKISNPSNKLKLFHCKIQNLEILKHYYRTDEAQSLLRLKINIEDDYKPIIKNKTLVNKISEIKNAQNKLNIIVKKKESTKEEDYLKENSGLPISNFNGFETNFNHKDHEIFYVNQEEQAKDSLDSSRILTKLDQKRVKLTDISFDSQIHDIYNPKFSSDESKENINFSINISNFSSNVFNTRQNNMINNNLPGVSNSEILSPDNISVINKSDNLQDQLNKNSNSLICYSHINKFSLPNSALSNYSEFKSYNDSKNNSHILVSDKKLIIEDNYFSKSTIPDSNKKIETCKHTDKSKSIIEEIKTNDTQNKSKIITPKSSKKIIIKRHQPSIKNKSIENYSIKKKEFPTSSFYATNNKKSYVQAIINGNNYESNNSKNAILLSSNEKKIEKPRYNKLSSNGPKLNGNVKKLLEFNNTIKNNERYKENSFSINKYSFQKQNNMLLTLKKSSTNDDIELCNQLYDNTHSMSSPKYSNKQDKIDKLIKMYSSGMDSKILMKNSFKSYKKNDYATTNLKHDLSKKNF